MRRELVAGALAFALGSLPLAVTGSHDPRGGTSSAGRIVSLSPSITEMIYALGALDRVVGVSSWVSWPPQVRNIRCVGGYLDVDLEVLVGVRPDIIFLQGVHSRVSEQARELGSRVLRIDMDTLAEIFEAARRIGREIGEEASGERVSRQLESEINELRRRSSGRRPLRTLLYIGHELPQRSGSLLTAGGRTFLSELLEASGGKNIFGELERAYAEVSWEAVVARSPELVMTLAPGKVLCPEEEKAAREFWRGLAGAKAAFITFEGALVPGPRIGELAREMERAISFARDGEGHSLQ